MLVKNHTDALLAQFPGPLSIGLSLPKHLLLLTIAGAFVAAGVVFIRFPELFVASSANSSSAVKGEGFLRLLVLLRVARNMREALAEFGWVVLVFGGIGCLTFVLKLVLGATGRCGLTLNREGFVVRDLRRSNFHSWLDVGDFDSLELPRNRGARKCLVFNDYRAPETPVDWLRSAGRNRALIEMYECPAEDLAVLMSVWREWAVAESTKPG